jgi:hypothetical protein
MPSPAFATVDGDVVGGSRAALGQRGAERKALPASRRKTASVAIKVSDEAGLPARRVQDRQLAGIASGAVHFFERYADGPRSGPLRFASIYVEPRAP